MSDVPPTGRPSSKSGPSSLFEVVRPVDRLGCFFGGVRARWWPGRAVSRSIRCPLHRAARKAGGLRARSSAFPVRPVVAVVGARGGAELLLLRGRASCRRVPPRKRRCWLDRAGFPAARVASVPHGCLVCLGIAPSSDRRPGTPYGPSPWEQMPDKGQGNPCWVLPGH